MQSKRNKNLHLHLRALLSVLIAVTVFTGVLAMPMAVSAASYGYVGYYCNKKNLKSGKLVVGDSRTCQLWNYDKDGASFVSTWAGHYGYGEQYNTQIDTAAKVGQMKTYIRDTIKKKGSCNVYVFATVYDYNGGSGYVAAANSVFRLAKTLKSYTYKSIKPKVTVVSLLGSRGVNLFAYNSYLKTKVKNGGMKWLGIVSLLQGSNGGYSSDNVHFNNTTLNNIWKYLK